MDERLRRLWAGSEAVALEKEGIKTVAFATGLSTKTIRSGIQELQVPLSQKTQGIASTSMAQKMRKPGGGRKSLLETDPTLIEDLEKLIAPATRGNPCSPLLWTAKSTSKLAKALEEMGHKISPRTVAKLLDKLGYSLQSNRKTKEPIEVKVHDFPDPEQGKVIPYGVYDLTNNTGWVNVGISHDTAEFAVASIRQWWRTMGKELYPEAEEILITADCFVTSQKIGGADP